MVLEFVECCFDTSLGLLTVSTTRLQLKPRAAVASCYVIKRVPPHPRQSQLNFSLFCTLFCAAGGSQATYSVTTSATSFGRPSDEILRLASGMHMEEQSRIKMRVAMHFSLCPEGIHTKIIACAHDILRSVNCNCKNSHLSLPL